MIQFYPRILFLTIALLLFLSITDFVGFSSVFEPIEIIDYALSSIVALLILFLYFPAIAFCVKNKNINTIKWLLIFLFLHIIGFLIFYLFIYLKMGSNAFSTEK